MTCPECGAPMVQRKSNQFPARPYFYGCSQFPACRATHGAHPDGTPLGTPADAETKQWRIRAHDSFDHLWKYGSMTRRQAYAWMQRAMKLNREQAHIGKFTKEQCQELIKRCGEG